ncbi:MAG: flagellar hook protein FlgE [Deltaproteobacteria bacterium]|nr:MAG: flagellar hook protein FlgE [Deltaproteobacteria bacterium]
MSLSSSFYTALSGLDTHTVAMQVVGDNIANLNTVGFKGSTALFEDLLGSAMTTVTGVDQTGVGAKVSTIDGNFTQGTLETTGVNTDVGITGRGFFVVKDVSTNVDYYTRAGHFNLDTDGYYVTPHGLRVQGYLYDSTGTNLIESLTDIQLTNRNMAAPRVTSEASMVLNLDATETALTWDPANPGGTSNYSTATRIYDSLGNAHNIQVYFTKTGAQAWDWNAMIDGSDVQGGTAGTPVLYGNGSLVFDNNGQLTTAMPGSFYSGAITFGNGLAASATTLDFSGSTQYGSPSAIQSVSQDGYASGYLAGVVIDSDGTISGNYTNGVTQDIAQLVLADFVNLYGLARQGSQLYMATSESGDPLYDQAGMGGMGTVASGMLEEANVDLAAEFIKMMINQRGFQANSKVITTTDEMMASLIAIK